MSTPSPATCLPADAPSLRATDDGVVMPVRVIPRASRTVLAGVRDGRLLVRLNAPPIDGAANEGLIRLLAKQLGVARRRVRIVGGDRSRLKPDVNRPGGGGRLSVDVCSDVLARAPPAGAVPTGCE